MSLLKVRHSEKVGHQKSFQNHSTVLLTYYDLPFYSYRVKANIYARVGYVGGL